MTVPTQGNQEKPECNDPDGVALRAALLGCLLGAALTAAAWITPSRPELPLYIAALSLFHLLEYWITARFNKSRVSHSSFLLSSNGKAYWAAQLSGIVEYMLISRHYTARLLGSGAAPLAFASGILFVLVGQLVRSWAMVHAGKSFSHQLAYEKDPEHVLVTSGIYSLFRHPSYFGFFWFGVGTQLMMSNVLSTVVFAVVLHRFFSVRIK